jgi:predicted Kef-type K+ transport protein
MHDLGMLMTFAGGLAGALVLGFLAHRLKLSPIIGHLLAGVLVGPFTLGFVANRAVAEQFAEIGGSGDTILNYLLLRHKKPEPKRPGSAAIRRIESSIN